MIFNKECLETLKSFKTNTIDSLITDPPAGISFMGKDWDKSDRFIESMTEIFKQCLRVMKPGAHGLVWAIPRTSHWTATALEDAGFEIRDVITHIFGSGFPKSMNISIAIDKQAGAMSARGNGFNVAGQNVQLNQNKELRSDHPDYVAPTGVTSEAKQFAGWGTALKPASEHWILIRKPCSEKTVAANVLKWGTGALNIDASRIGSEVRTNLGMTSLGSMHDDNWIPKDKVSSTVSGRFPANLVLSHTDYCTESQCDIECAVKALDEQSGTLKSGDRKPTPIKEGSSWKNSSKQTINSFSGDSGGASRFFYCAKASKKDKNNGLEGLPLKQTFGNDKGDGLGRGISHSWIPNQNFHPTVKSTKLMSYLIKLITPPNGIILDPFMGSGSTGVAAKHLGFKFIGIERDQEYFEISKARISNALKIGAF